ncbi:hypothetical protein DHD05_00355 [Arenibacter sp. N53]|uniref:hypothetical protein n=1 Tax=Arenibacter TaxID=178469 RepID=UPI000CD47F99|nr:MULTISPECIES: hypothetical protein [Arenibacter]MCM4150029.1 hypothetical protein [Arenibacter sp. N53]
MSKKLITLVFEKAEGEIGSPVKTRLATHLSDMLQENYKYSLNERTLRDYYTNYIEKEEANNEDLKPQLIKCFCQYLGFKDYAHFIAEHPSEIEVSTEEKNEEKVEVNDVGVFKKYKEALILVFSAITITCLTYFGFVKEEQNCMIWRENHYEQTVCTGDPMEIPINALILKNLRRITEIDSLLERKEKRKELWYDKSNGKVEFFTYHGYHPENKKALKNVTDHIFQTYALDKSKDSLEIGLSD